MGTMETIMRRVQDGTIILSARGTAKTPRSLQATPRPVPSTRPASAHGHHTPHDGMFSFVGAAIEQVWSASCLVGSLISTAVMMPVNVIMYSHSSALVSATCVGVLALLRANSEGKRMR
jgi:hypothetical protein